jgi:hypothetical protein
MPKKEITDEETIVIETLKEKKPYPMRPRP